MCQGERKKLNELKELLKIKQAAPASTGEEEAVEGEAQADMVDFTREQAELEFKIAVQRVEVKRAERQMMTSKYTTDGRTSTNGTSVQKSTQKRCGINHIYAHFFHTYSHLLTKGISPLCWQQIYLHTCPLFGVHDDEDTLWCA